jgi:hypothetical protein
MNVTFPNLVSGALEEVGSLSQSQEIWALPRPPDEFRLLHPPHPTWTWCLYQSHCSSQDFHTQSSGRTLASSLPTAQSGTTSPSAPLFQSLHVNRMTNHAHVHLLGSCPPHGPYTMEATAVWSNQWTGKSLIPLLAHC